MRCAVATATEDASRAVASSRPFIRRVISSVNIQYKIEIRKRTAAIMHDMAPYKTKTTVLFRRSLCDSDRIQTCNRLIRSQVLYSVELRSHSFAFASANIRRIFLLCKQITKNFFKKFCKNSGAQWRRCCIWHIIRLLFDVFGKGGFDVLAAQIACYQHALGREEEVGRYQRTL